jgi:hypothetical protein
MYLSLNDQVGALKAFAWFEKQFPDEGGFAGHRLCWALTLHPAGRDDEALEQLAATIFCNRYALPMLLGLGEQDLAVNRERDDWDRQSAQSVSSAPMFPGQSVTHVPSCLAGRRIDLRSGTDRHRHIKTLRRGRDEPPGVAHGSPSGARRESIGLVRRMTKAFGHWVARCEPSLCENL